MENGFVLALYDFASKQNYIYRTSKIKEISGASVLLDGMYGKFIELLSENQIVVANNPKNNFKMSDFEAGGDDGAVLYEGGGNLMVLYRSREKYVLANKIISRFLIENVPGLNLITCCVDCTGNFIEDRHNLYEENRIRKNQAPSISASAVLPITQIDQLTYMPVFEKTTENKEELTLSEDRKVKRKAYEKNPDSNIDELNEGMLAVIYVDGNSMGNHLKNSIPEYSADEFMSYDDGVERLRAFSNEVHKCFVAEASKAIASYVQNQELSKKGFRQVIGGGDEITIICNAEIAYDVLQVYFKSLNNSNEERLANGGSNAQRYYACAGIAVFHAKSPFSIAYEIAEAACESAKKRSREKDGNYFDVYYCHAGIVDEFDNLRKNEEKITGRPYQVEEAKTLFSKYLHLVQEAGRANVKAIGAAARKSVSLYKIEAQRINAYLSKKQAKFADGEVKFFAFADDASADDIKIKEEMKVIFDMSEYYDLWFSKRGEE